MSFVETSVPGVHQQGDLRELVEQIGEDIWKSSDYTMNGETWIGETAYTGHRLVVRGIKLHDPWPSLFPTYRYLAFINDGEGDAVTLDADRRRHAVLELAIRDLKEGSGLEHCLRATSTRTLPGPCWLESRTTWCDGLAHSGSISMDRSSPRPSVASSWPRPADSPTPRDVDTFN